MSGVSIDAELVRRFIAGQFHRWAELDVAPVPLGGVDNRTLRLGDELTGAEHRGLPVLAPHLPLPIPVPVARGVPHRAIPSTGRSAGGSTARPRPLIGSMT